MNDLFPWLPLGVSVDAGLTVGRLLQSGEAFQLVLSGTGDKSILFLKEALYKNSNSNICRAFDSLKENGVLREYFYDDERFLFGVFERSEAPRRLASLVNSPGNSTTVPLRPLAFALAELKSVEPKAVWSEALYLSAEKICLPTTLGESAEAESDRYKLAVSLLVGAIPDLSLNIDMIKKLNPNLETSEIREFLSILGFEDVHLISKFGNARIRNPEEFVLPGRPELQDFFREYVIDFFFRFEEYRSMGFSPPNGILLYGPPGSGKTFAVNKLAEFLKWSVFDVDIGSIGSPYIHETSKRLKQVFETASEQSPSIVLLEEIDALATKRGTQVHESKNEEVSQLLRLLEKAANNGILVIATTNRYDALDSAIIRRGRFDHVIEVGFPSKIEITLALRNLLELRPTTDTIEVEQIAAGLEGRPMSDVAWVVNEAARFAVRNSQKKIDESLLNLAISRLGKNRQQN